MRRFMKYFTIDWFAGNIEDSEVERIREAYWRQLHEMLPDVKYPARAFMAAKVRLHDALMYSSLRDGCDLEVRFIAGDLPIGYFDVRIRYLAVADMSVVPELHANTIEVLYDEFEFTDPGKTAIRHSFISAKRREYSIVFSNLDFAIEHTTRERDLELWGMRE